MNDCSSHDNCHESPRTSAMKKICVLLGLLFVVTGCKGSNPTASSNLQEQSTHSQEMTSEQESSEDPLVKSSIPTLFIHGYAGGIASFGSMIQRIEAAEIAEKEMTITVLADGTLETEGELTGEATNPLIQVIFQDNQSHEWNQAEWIRIVMAYLQTTYQTETVNLVGHSMGGVSSLRYLGTYAGENLPTVAKFTAIGAPFNDFIDTQATQSMEDLLANGPAETSDRYADYEQLVPNIVPFPVQLIAGQLSESDLSDGTVPLTSALSVNHLLEVSGFPVTVSIITSQAQHSQLHENLEVDQLVADFLWRDNQ